MEDHAIVGLTPPRHVVLGMALQFRDRYRLLADNDNNNDNVGSPVHEFPRRVQVQDLPPHVVEHRMLMLQDQIGQNGPLTLVNWTRVNIQVAGNLLFRRTILANDQLLQHPAQRRRDQFRRALGFIFTSVQQRICRTMRELFYSDVQCFTNQATSDQITHDLCVSLRCTRNNLYIFAEDRGYIIGAVRFGIEHDRDVDCNSERSPLIKCRVGVQIPPFLDSVVDIRGDVELLFILYIEKYSAFSQLAQLNFHNDYRCLLITGKGYADLATKLFLKRVSTELRLPIFCLTDCDVAGLEIYIDLKYGSQNMAYNSRNIACPRLHYLGVSVTDLNVLSCPTQMLGEEELNKMLALRKHDWVRQDLILSSELIAMQEIELKASLEAVNTLTTNCLARNYLPLRLVTVMARDMPAVDL